MENVNVVYERPRPMSGSEIAEALDCSRMAVSQTLKRGFKKVYFLLKKTNRHLDSFEVAVTMSQIFQVSLDNDKEMVKFFNLFPMDIKKEIKTNAKNKFRNCSKCPFETMCELL